MLITDLVIPKCKPLPLVEDISKQARFYQVNAVLQAADYFRQGFTRIMIKAPTGTGKTLISKLICLSHEIRDACGLHKGKIRVLFISNKNRLNRQAAAEYAENLNIELITQSAMSKVPKEVVDAGWDITILDECHHEAMGSLQNMLDELTGKPLIGFSADDQRGDGLTLKFDRVVEAISMQDASEYGFIEKSGINTIVDTSGKDKSILANKVLSEYHQHMGNTIIFFRTEREVHSTFRHITKTLGLTASLLDSNSNEEDMDKALDDLSSGNIQFLVNCQKIGEGIDTAAVTDVLLCRQFNSAGEKKQYIGRAIRPDSPCAAWEFVNPVMESVSAKSVLGITKYERLIFIRDDKWNEIMICGSDDTWGKMSQLRMNYVFKPETIQEEQAKIRKSLVIGKISRANRTKAKSKLKYRFIPLKMAA